MTDTAPSARTGIDTRATATGAALSTEDKHTAARGRVRYRLRLCSLGPWWHLRRSVTRAAFNAYDDAGDLLNTHAHNLCGQHMNEAIRAVASVPHVGQVDLADGRSLSWSTEDDDDA